MEACYSELILRSYCLIYTAVRTFYIENIYNMNDSSPSARLAQKLFGLASKKYGAPYCGSPLIDDALSQGVRFWVSGIAVGGVGIPGMYVERW